jgi:hypothetical protein
MSESIAFEGGAGGGTCKSVSLVAKSRPNERGVMVSENSGETAQFGQALEAGERSSLVNLETKWRWVILPLFLVFSLVGIFLHVSWS